jgi:mannosyltransferase
LLTGGLVISRQIFRDLPRRGRQSSGSLNPKIAPASIAVLGFLVAFTGSWIPSFWNDEIATISAADRSPAELWTLLQSVDAVHGAYYFFMHLWTSVFGTSEVALRVPSAMAAGLACGGTVLIGRRVGSNAIGIAAGLVLAVLPRMVWAGTEARQYAVSALIAVCLTLLLVRAWESNRVLDWVLYGACASLGVFVFMFFALAIVAHAVAALVLRRRVLATLLTSGIAAAVVLPFLLAAMKQTAQVAWIQDRSLIQNLTVAAVKQYFYGDDRPTGNLPPQWVLAVVVVLAITQLALIAVGVAYAARSADLRTLAVVCLSGVVIPMGGLLVISVLAQPVYVARYLTFTAPAFALLVGLGLERLRQLDKLRQRRIRLLPITAAVVIGASLVPQATLKSFINEPGDTERHIAAIIAAESGHPASVVYQRPEQRDAALAYPEAFADVRDLSLDSAPAASGTLWGTNVPVSRQQLAGRGQVWFVGAGGDDHADLSVFAAAGCKEGERRLSERLLLVSYKCP